MKETQTDTLIAQVVALAPEANREFLTIGRLLRQIKAQAKRRFQDAIKASGLKRRAQHFVKLVDSLDGLGIPDDRLQRVGWVKLAAIIPKLTKANALSLLAMAETNSAPNVRRVIRGDDPLWGYRAVNLFLSADDYETFRRVVMRHGATANGRSLVGQDEALMLALAKLNAIEGENAPAL